MNDIDYAGIGPRIRIARKLTGLLQAEFSKKLDINPSTLSDIENSKHLPRIDFLCKMVSAFNVNINYILSGNGEPLLSSVNKLEIFFEDNPFGDSTEDIIDILEFMKKSPLFFRAVIFYAKEYFTKNKKYILNELREHEELKKEEVPKIKGK